MAPEEIQALERRAEERQRGHRAAVGRARPPPAPAPLDATRELGHLLLPALADPAAAAKITEQQRRIVAESVAARQAAADAAAVASAATQRMEQIIALARLR